MMIVQMKFAPVISNLKVDVQVQYLSSTTVFPTRFKGNKHTILVEGELVTGVTEPRSLINNIENRHGPCLEV